MNDEPAIDVVRRSLDAANARDEERVMGDRIVRFRAYLDRDEAVAIARREEASAREASGKGPLRSA